MVSTSSFRNAQGIRVETAMLSVHTAYGMNVNSFRPKLNEDHIYRHDFVATSVVNSLMTVQLETNVLVLSAVFTPLSRTCRTPKVLPQPFLNQRYRSADACIKTIEGLRCIDKIHVTKMISG